MAESARQARRIDPGAGRRSGPGRDPGRRPVKPKRRRWRTVLRLLVLALILVFVAVLLAEQWQQVRPLLGRLTVAGLLAATVAVLAGHLATFLSWRAILTD